MSPSPDRKGRARALPPRPRDEPRDQRGVRRSGFGAHGDSDVSTDRILARIARGQRGLVTRAQLLAAGIGEDAVDARLRRGGLHRMHRGVYLVGHDVAPPFARELAAVLACGRDAVVARRSALALHGVGHATAGNVQVLIVGRRPRTRADIEVRCCAALPPVDVTGRHGGIPVTTAARTLVDLAGELSLPELEDLVNEVQVLRLASTAAIAAALRRVGPRRGTAALRSMLAESDRGVTRSRAERRFLSLIRSAGLPMPETNARLAGYRVDALWRRQRVIVEVDSWQFHGTRRAFERDRRRDADVLAAGHRVLRVTWWQMDREPLAVVARLAAVLVPEP